MDVILKVANTTQRHLYLAQVDLRLSVDLSSYRSQRCFDGGSAGLHSDAFRHTMLDLAKLGHIF